jgi:hypothetical protein
MDKPEQYENHYIKARLKKSGQYRLVRYLGLGRIGWSYEAEFVSASPYAYLGDDLGTNDTASGRSVFRCELLPAEPTTKPDALTRLRAFTESQHDHLLACHDFGLIGDESGLPNAIFVVTQVPEQSLEEVFASTNPPSERDLRELTCSIGSALAHLHHRGIVHGCVNGAHIVRAQGRWRLAPTVFVSPEATSADDVLSFGRTLLRLLSPRSRPQSSENTVEVAADLPPEWQSVLDGCLESDRAKRWSAARLAFAFTELPPALTDVRCTRRGDVLELTWFPPHSGRVGFYRLDEGSCVSEGDVLLESELSGLGCPITVGEGNCQVRIEPGAPWKLVPVTVDSGAAVIGRAITISPLPDVTDLRVMYRGGELHAQWNWPDNVSSAVVAYRTDRPPNLLNDSDVEITVKTYDRLKAEVYGRFSFPPPNGARLFLTVFSRQKTTTGRWQYAGGTTLEIPLQRCRTVRYRLRKQSTWLGFGHTREYDLVVTPDAETALPELILVAAPRSLPQNIRDGTVLHQISEGTRCSPKNPYVYRFHPEDLKGRWGLRLFLSKEELYAWVELIAEPAAGLWL